jgi:hypothetical protein
VLFELHSLVASIAGQLCCWGSDVLSLTLREEHRLRVFENKILRRIFETMREEVTGGWIKFDNVELYNFHYSSDIIRVIKSWRIGWTEHVAHPGEMINGYKILDGKPEGKKSPGNI